MITKKRKPWLALLLTVLCLPVGYAYAGNPKKAIATSLLVLLTFPATFVVIKTEFTLLVLLIMLLLAIGIPIAILIDTYKTAKRQPENYTMKSYNRWWVYLGVFIGYSFIFIPFTQHYTREHLIQAYKIPAGSMLPTLEIGDHILVDKSIYKKQRVEHGDLIVFPFPKNPSIEYIKRVAGVPGDKIEIKNKKLYLNDSAQDPSQITFSSSTILPSTSSPRDNFGPITVPDNALFVLGDNRDNSYDSRFWGFVPLDTVKGKVVNIYWSWNREGSTIRWDRIGIVLK